MSGNAAHTPTYVSRKYRASPARARARGRGMVSFRHVAGAGRARALRADREHSPDRGPVPPRPRPAGENNEEALRRVVLTLWQTRILRTTRLTVDDEIENGLALCRLRRVPARSRCHKCLRATASSCACFTGAGAPSGAAADRAIRRSWRNRPAA